MSLPVGHYFNVKSAAARTLTADFLRVHIVNFNPTTVAEARAIQEKLLEMGLVWLTGEKVVQRLDACIERGLHVDKGQIVTGNDRGGQYVDATLADLTGSSAVLIKGVAGVASVKSPVTRDFFEGKQIIFKPVTVEEAAFIQESLFAFGFSWNEGQRHVILQKECVEKKMNVSNGKIRYGTLTGAAIEVPISDLPGYDENDLRSPQEKLQSRVETLEAEVAALKEMVTKLTVSADPVRIIKPSVSATLQRKPPSV